MYVQVLMGTIHKIGFHIQTTVTYDLFSVDVGGHWRQNVFHMKITSRYNLPAERVSSK